MQKFDVQVQIRIQETTEGVGYRSEGLQINETITVSAGGFVEVCAILSQFHDLAQILKEEKKKWN